MLSRLSVFGLLILFATINYGAGICDGFIIQMNNRLSEALLVTHIITENGELDPPLLTSIAANGQTSFAVTHAHRTKAITGEMWLYTMQVPSKKIMIKFNLQDKGIYCEHRDQSSSEEHHTSTSRSFGWGVAYTINY